MVVDKVRSGTGSDVITYEIHNNLYLNITNRCTLRCRFCPKFNKVWDVHSYNLRLSHEPTAHEILQCIGDPKKYRQIVFCGLGESTLRLETLTAVALGVKQRGGMTRLNTDGLANLVYERDVVPELAPYIDEISVSMNTQNNELYQRHCRPPVEDAYEHMLDFVGRARDGIGRVSVTALEGLDGVDVGECRRIAEKLKVHYRNRILGVVG